MKKRIASFIIALIFVLSLTSCGGDPVNTESTTTSSVKPPINIEDTTLSYGVGQADENGVFVVPDGITFIREGAFANDTKLKEIIIPESVTTIGSAVFYGCSSLKKVTMTNNVTSIGSEAFIGCSSLEKITIPTGVDTLFMNTFSYCTSLESVTIPDNVKVIGSACFMGCTSLQYIELPSTLEELGASCFFGCTSLSDVDGLEKTKIKAITSSTFESCTSLQQISLPENLETIGSNVFNGCTSLYDIKFPETIKTVGAFALSATPWYQEKNDKYVIIGDGVLVKCNVNPNTNDIPGTIDLSQLPVKSIGNSCFIDAASNNQPMSYGYKFSFHIKNVIFPEGLTSIGDQAFAGCINMEKVQLPASLERIGDYAFFGVVNSYYSYLEVSFAPLKNLKSIGAYAFYGCSKIVDVDLPQNVEFVGDSAFIETKAYYDFIDESSKSNSGNKFYVVGDGMLLFAYIAKGETVLAIPEGTKFVVGGSCTGWDSQYVYNDFEDNDNLSETIKSRHRLTYTIKSLSLPEGVKVIGENAFFRLSGIDNVVIPDTVTIIDSSAFMLCGSLKTIKLSKNLESLGNSCFAYANLKSVQLPHSLVSIGFTPFLECGELTEIVIPSSVKAVGAPLLDDSLTKLTKIYISLSYRKQLTSIIQVFNSGTTISYFEEE